MSAFAAIGRKIRKLATASAAARAAPAPAPAKKTLTPEQQALINAVKNPSSSAPAKKPLTPAQIEANRVAGKASLEKQHDKAVAAAPPATAPVSSRVMTPAGSTTGVQVDSRGAPIPGAAPVQTAPTKPSLNLVPEPAPTAPPTNSSAGTGPLAAPSLAYLLYAESHP